MGGPGALRDQIPSLAFFLYAVVLMMDAMAIMKFQRGTYNYAADAKMLLFFTEMTGVTAVTLAVLALLSIVVKNFWCRYLCARTGRCSGWSAGSPPAGRAGTGAACIDCKACTRACPVEIRVYEKPSVWTLECMGCMSCVSACPVEDCLTVTRRGKAGWSPYSSRWSASARSSCSGAWPASPATGTLRSRGPAGRGVPAGGAFCTLKCSISNTATYPTAIPEVAAPPGLTLHGLRRPEGDSVRGSAVQ